MRIVICLSHLAVPAALTVVEASDDDFLIVTSKDNIVSMFERLYPAEKIVLLDSRSLLSRHPHRMVMNLYRTWQHKREIRRDFEAQNGASVFLLHSTFCELESWLVKQLSKQNQVIYDPVERNGDLPIHKSPVARIGKWMRWLVYGIRFVPRKGPNYTSFDLSEEFLRKIGAIRCPIEVHTGSACTRILEGLPDVSRARILILSGGTAGLYVDPNEYTGRMDALIAALTDKFGLERLAIKAHPRFPQRLSTEKSLAEIPSDIAANLVLEHFDVVIGYASTTLAQAANLGKISISLTHLMEPYDCQVRDGYCAYLRNNTSGTINYPRRIEEVIDLADHLD